MREPAEWVGCLQSGDDQAWRDFVQVFSRFVPIVCNRLGLNEADRQEVLQEMTLTAFRSIHNLRDPGRLTSWTFTIAHRCAVGVWKSKVRRPQGDGGPPEDLPSEQIAPDELRARLEEIQHLREAVGDLSPDCRDLLSALYLRDPRPSYKEISRSQSMPIGSIGPNLARCLKKLRSSLRTLSNRPGRATAGLEAGGPALRVESPGEQPLREE